MTLVPVWVWVLGGVLNLVSCGLVWYERRLERAVRAADREQVVAAMSLVRGYQAVMTELGIDCDVDQVRKADGFTTNVRVTRVVTALDSNSIN